MCQWNIKMNVNVKRMKQEMAKIINVESSTQPVFKSRQQIKQNRRAINKTKRNKLTKLKTKKVRKLRTMQTIPTV